MEAMYSQKEIFLGQVLASKQEHGLYGTIVAFDDEGVTLKLNYVQKDVSKEQPTEDQTRKVPHEDIDGGQWTKVFNEADVKDKGVILDWSLHAADKNPDYELHLAKLRMQLMMDMALKHVRMQFKEPPVLTIQTKPTKGVFLSTPIAHPGQLWLLPISHSVHVLSMEDMAKVEDGTKNVDSWVSTEMNLPNGSKVWIAPQFTPPNPSLRAKKGAWVEPFWAVRRGNKKEAEEWRNDPGMAEVCLVQLNVSGVAMVTMPNHLQDEMDEKAVEESEDEQVLEDSEEHRGAKPARTGAGNVFDGSVPAYTNATPIEFAHGGKVELFFCTGKGEKPKQRKPLVDNTNKMKKQKTTHKKEQDDEL